MLIRNAEIWSIGLADVRIAGERIAEIGQLSPRPQEQVIDAASGALLPGLHDHHIHLAGLAARRESVVCGPPEVNTADELAERLTRPGTGWLRGILYHESVMGLPSAKELDRLVPDRPVRIQHRSGRMWLLNSPALAELLAHAESPPGLERAGVGFTGRLFDEDQWLRSALASQPPDFATLSLELASHGITGITDMSPRNDPAMAGHFARQMEAHALLQHCMLAGELSLAQAQARPWRLGPAKLHLHEAALTTFEEASAFIDAAHGQNRPIAIHCVSEVELIYALAVLADAGPMPGDRIEHASVASPELVERMAELGLAVCVQPHFIAERGDRYLLDVEPHHHDDLYRLATLRDAGIPLAGGSDAPFASADPWAAMRAAVTRQTQQGQSITPKEALSPEEALALYLTAPEDFSRQRRIAVDAAADLCLLDRPWSQARLRLSSGDVRAAFIAGRLANDRIDQPPV